MQCFGSTRYRCTNKNCQSAIHVDNNLSKVLSVLHGHNRNIILKNIGNRQKLNSRIERKSDQLVYETE